MYIKLLTLVVCVTLFKGCFAAIGKSNANRGLKQPGSGRSHSGSRNPSGSVRGAGIGGIGPGVGGIGLSGLSPGREETIDIDSTEGGTFAGFSGDRDDEDLNGGSGSGVEIIEKPCEQMKQDIMDRQVVGQFDPVCTLDGRFKSRQCDRRNMCWCVDPMGLSLTGKTSHKETSEAECDRINGNDIEENKNLETVQNPTPKPTDDEIYNTDIKNDLDNMGPGGDVNRVNVQTKESNPNGVESIKQEDDGVEEADTSLLMGHPGILAGIIGGAVVGLLCAVLLVMFIVYRMRKKDEGSYALDEPRKSPTLHGYRPANQKEYYA